MSIGQTSNHDKFNRTQSNDVQEKRYNFCSLQYFGAPEGPPAPKFTNLGDDV